VSLALRSTRPVSSKHVPIWGDEFDLRRYFNRIHPDQYELRNQREYGFAQQVLGTVEAITVNWVGVYRTALLLRHKHPELVARVAECVRSVLQRGILEHLRWYEMPHQRTGGKAPRDWFREENLSELAERLRFQVPVGQSGLFADLPLSSEIRHGSVTNLGPIFRPPMGREDRSLRQLVRLLISAEDWGDEFDLGPYLSGWSPMNYILQNPADFALALKIYTLVRTEIAGWIHVYRSALVAGSRRGDVLEAIARCAVSMVGSNPGQHVQWYKSPHSEFFSGASPEQWFVGAELFELNHLLSLGTS
jgi:hypothetical protein